VFLCYSRVYADFIFVLGIYKIIIDVDREYCRIAASSSHGYVYFFCCSNNVIEIEKAISADNHYVQSVITVYLILLIMFRINCIVSSLILSILKSVYCATYFEFSTFPARKYPLLAVLPVKVICKVVIFII